MFTRILLTVPVLCCIRLTSLSDSIIEDVKPICNSAVSKLPTCRGSSQTAFANRLYMNSNKCRPECVLS